MAGVSTGVSLLTVGGSGLKSSIRTFLQMESGSNYINQVTGVTATSVTGSTNTQTTTGQVNATLGSYHLINNPQSASTVSRVILNSQVTPEYVGSYVTRDMSAAFWLKGDSDGGFGASNSPGFRFMLFGTGGSTDSSYNGVGVTTSDVITLYNNTTGTVGSGGGWATNSSWRFYVFNFKYNSGTSDCTVTCYINGVLQSGSPTIARFDNSNSWLFTSSVFQGTNATDFQNNCGMDNLSIQDKLLSQSEVDYLYNSGNGRNYSDINI